MRLWMLSLACVALVMSACGGGGNSSTSTPKAGETPNKAAPTNATTKSDETVRLHPDDRGPSVGGQTWLAKIAAGAGDKEVAIICDDQGVWAYAIGWRLPILRTVADWCVVDPFSNVVWMATEEKVSVLDLRADSATPEVVITGWPETRPVNIFHSAWPRSLGNTSHNDVFGVQIDLNTQKTSILEGNFYYTVEPKEIEAAGRWIRIQNKKLLARLAKRSTAKILLKVKKSQCPKRLRSIPADACEDSDCGSTEGIPGTSYCRVLVSQSCGDGCYLDFAFYDTGAKRFLFGYKPGRDSPDLPFASSAALEISPSGRYVIANGTLSDWTKTLVAEGAAGWINPGHHMSGDM